MRPLIFFCYFQIYLLRAEHPKTLYQRNRWRRRAEQHQFLCPGDSNDLWCSTRHGLVPMDEQLSALSCEKPEDRSVKHCSICWQQHRNYRGSATWQRKLIFSDLVGSRPWLQGSHAHGNTESNTRRSLRVKSCCPEELQKLAPLI